MNASDRHLAPAPRSPNPQRPGPQPMARTVRRPANLVTASVVVSLLLLIAPPSTRADRGEGSVRAAGRAAPESRSFSAPPPDRGPAHPEPTRAAPDVRVDVHSAPPPRPAPAPAPRDWDDHDEDVRHGGDFARGVPTRALRGAHLHDLPHHIVVSFHNQNFFCDDDGNYYQQQGSDYVVVQPPVGVIVPALPPGVVTLVAGPTTYCYLDGIFYVAQDNAYAVVNPPPGIIVPDLPSGATQLVVNGTVCYQFNGFNYQPSVQNGVTVYTVSPI